jgi:hypothetical protein
MYLWETFHLAELNGHLTRPLSFEEVKFNFLSSPDLSTLHRYSFNFIPNVLGAPKQTYVLQIHNPGKLTSSFHIHFPNEKELEMDPWAEELEVLEE